MESLKTLLSNLQARWAALSAREQRLLMLMGAAVSAFTLFLVLFSFGSAAATKEQRIQTKLEQLEKVQELATSYGEAEAQRRAAEQQLTQSNVRLMSYLEQKATQAGLVIPTMSPKGDTTLGDGRIVESSVELTMTDITVRNLVDFLGSVESGSGVVKVKYLRVQPRPASENLTAWVNVATYRLKQ
ncbi:MAG: type II secretion system protein M [Myxococcaceae bacterium]|nr:type II secretion system protein M [Myxococcaceae bacterium]MCI0673565.1 type II secretion system protein M [Myxococcaceae bacterium]